ncbi:hypothetical protein GQ44DRAFT_626693, partial [Phaeosphaeriaceae sp. PMI808]
NAQHCHVTFMPHQKYKTQKERLEARKKQNQNAQRAYRARSEAALKESECPESDWEIPENPSPRLILEMKLARMSRYIDDVVNIMQSATDASMKEYIMEQIPCIQRKLDTLRVPQCDEPEPTATFVDTNTTGSVLNSTPHLPAQLSPIPDVPKYPTSGILETSSKGMLQYLEAQIYQEKIRNSVGWGEFSGQRLGVFAGV